METVYFFLTTKFIEHLEKIPVTRDWLTMDVIRAHFEGTIFYPISMSEEPNDVVVHFTLPQSFYTITDFPIHLFKLTVNKKPSVRRVKFCKKWFDKGLYGVSQVALGDHENMKSSDPKLLGDILAAYQAHTSS